MKIVSNWTVSNGDGLEKIVTYSSEIMGSLIDNVRVDNCVCLIKTNIDDTSSKPEVQITTRDVMTHLDILSESSLVEVFGKDNEYLYTCNSNFIDDFEEMAVYQTRIVLPDIFSCKLKFGKMKHPSRLWLYSIQLTVDKFKTSNLQNRTLFNLENVHKLLSNSNQEISERAEKFKTLYDLCNTSYLKGFNRQPTNFENVLGLFNSEKKLQTTNSEIFEGKEPEELCNKPTDNCVNVSFEKLRLIDSLQNLNESNLNSSNMEILKSYINNKFSDLEQVVVNHIDTKISQLRAESNSNFEKIFRILDTLTTDKNLL
ncbi:hypothetical protein RUM43_007997 [Polyplax serrata]|uniref:Uncharacterized protein n=1 Tax=Polyplax serrata TaxID=468196 RepID=A0AAN8S869_POLSC